VQKNANVGYCKPLNCRALYFRDFCGQVSKRENKGRKFVFVQEIIQFPVLLHATGPQNAKFKGSKCVSTKKQQYKRAHENLGV